MIEIKNLSFAYDDKKVYENADFTIGDGKICGLIGINGAGKSTLLRIMAGCYLPNSGDVLYDGKSSSDYRTRKDIFFLSDDPYYTNHFDCRKLADLYKTFYKNFSKKKFYDLCRESNLPMRKSLSKFSKGMRRKAFINAAVAVGPKYLLMDEVFDGLDPLAKVQFKNIIKNMVKEHGTTVFVASHSIKEVGGFCDEFAVVDKTTIKKSEDYNDSEYEYNKFRMAYKNIPDKTLFEKDNIISCEIEGRFVTVICKGNEEESENYIMSTAPAVMDKVEFNLEELFMINNGMEDENV